MEFQLPRTGDQERINIGFGTYPKLSLANARKKAVEAHKLLAQGIDLDNPSGAHEEASPTQHPVE